MSQYTLHSQICYVCGILRNVWAEHPSSSTYVPERGHIRGDNFVYRKVYRVFVYHGAEFEEVCEVAKMSYCYQNFNHLLEDLLNIKE